MQCKAELHVLADEGHPYRATMICNLETDHFGPHEERYPRGDNKTTVLVIWEGDDRPVGKEGGQ